MSDRKAKIFGIGIILISIFFSFQFISQNKQGKKVVSKLETQTISGKIINEIKLKKSTRGGRLIKIILAEFPNHKFYLKRPEFNALDQDQFFNSFTKGSKIQLTVWKSDYESKIGKKEFNLLEKILRKNRLDIVGVSDDNYIYLREINANIVRSNFHTKSNFLIGMSMTIIGGIVGFIFMFMGAKPDANTC